MSKARPGRTSLDPRDLAIAFAIQAARECRASLIDPGRWPFAIDALHKSLTAALVESLTQTDGTGALMPQNARALWRYYEQGRTDPTASPPDPRVGGLLSLLEAARKEHCFPFDDTSLCLDPNEVADIERLSDFRDQIEHPKPGAHVLLTDGLPRIARSTAKALSQLFQLSSLVRHIDADEVDRARAAVELILQLPDQA